MTQKPVWLLDIDGVIAASPCRPTSKDIWSRSEWVRVSAFDESDYLRTVLVAEPVLAFLKATHELGLAEIRWHTTWRHNAPGLGRKLGLPEFPVHVPEYAYTGRYSGKNRDWWKYELAEKVVVEEKRSLLWTDDHIDMHVTEAQQRTLRRLAEDRLLMVWPKELDGLTQDDLGRIRQFLDAAQSESGEAK